MGVLFQFSWREIIQSERRIASHRVVSIYDASLGCVQIIPTGLSMYAGTLAIIAHQLHRIRALVLLARSRDSLLQPRYVHVLDGLREVREILVNERTRSYKRVGADINEVVEEI